MADNTVLNPGAGGDVIATDDIGGVKHELVKVEYGVDGTATQVSETNPLPVKEYSGSSAVTSVADSASSVTILAANTSRRGATIYNDSTEILYLKLGATATTTDFTVKMVSDAYYEVPFGYVGIIDGIWAANAGGSARVTELT